mmetsp:Transcript_37755/g.125069  ORF Transcript_37755/g.125069 Transcript_37755/m.125069 type:complete len:278 (+) Transcript_37755:217-1050(+)
MSNARSAPVIVKAADSRTDKGQPTSSPRELAAGRSRAGGGSDAAARSSCSAKALSPFLVLWARMRCDTSSSAALSSGGGGAPGVGGPFGIWCETVEPCRCSRWMPSLPTQPSERMTASVPPASRVRRRCCSGADVPARTSAHAASLEAATSMTLQRWPTSSSEKKEPPPCACDFVRVECSACLESAAPPCSMSAHSARQCSSIAASLWAHSCSAASDWQCLGESLWKGERNTASDGNAPGASAPSSGVPSSEKPGSRLSPSRAMANSPRAFRSAKPS